MNKLDPEGCLLSFELLQVQNVKYKRRSHKHLSVSGLAIDDHPFGFLSSVYSREALEMYFFDSFSSHHRAQGEGWIVLDKIIKNPTWPRIVFEGVRLYGNFTELYWGQFQISCNTGLLTFWDLRFSPFLVKRRWEIVCSEIRSLRLWVTQLPWSITHSIGKWGSGRAVVCWQEFCMLTRISEYPDIVLPKVRDSSWLPVPLPLTPWTAETTCPASTFKNEQFRNCNCEICLFGRVAFKEI